MKVLHVPFVYFPTPCGGTEVYVAALARQLDELGVESVIASPGHQAEQYEHEGHRVHRFAIDPAPSLEVVYGEGDKVAADGFGGVLDEEKPSLVHFHASSNAVSVMCLDECSRRGVPTVFTYHTATASCSRGTLMRWGARACDGKLRATTCAACMLHALGVPKVAAWAFALVSPVTQHFAPCLPNSARWQVPLRARPLTTARHDNIRRWFDGMDHIIAKCAWTERLLAINGVPQGKVSKVRHGLTQVHSETAPDIARSAAAGRPLRLVFLGRLDVTKGLHLLLDALEQAPELSVELDVFTVIEAEGSPYAKLMRQRLAQDKRVRVCPAIPAGEVVRTLSAYDALLVPSQGIETGPLVVLEAFAAGIPVVGSGFGGIAEWVTHEVDGLLVDEASAEAWCVSLKRLVAEPGLLAKLRAGVKPPRTMRQVALEVYSVYQELRAA
jgi:glycosyltransferase involved in cell wall biosynthesis